MCEDIGVCVDEAAQIFSVKYIQYLHCNSQGDYHILCMESTPFMPPYGDCESKVLMNYCKS